MENLLIDYLKNLGITVHLNTKARGHQGFFLKNRIDISKNIAKERLIPTLLHEFTHFVHEKIEPEMHKTGGSLERIFNTSNVEILEKELIAITNFVDKHSLCEKFLNHKDEIKKEIKSLEQIIKFQYPNFMRSKKFKEFDKYIKHSKAKYLLKYDRVKYITPFLRRVEYYSIESLEQDFADMPKAFAAYIKLKSFLRKQKRISSRINKMKKYYSKPTELFSRFIEALYLDREYTFEHAPNSCDLFFNLLNTGYYSELKNVLEMLQIYDNRSIKNL